jgi:curved DNA-binding protein CbpA
MTGRDYYETLGLTPEADGTAINRTYWHLARGFQAAAPADPRAHHQLDDLNEAYGVLGTPHLREAYDAARRASGTNASSKRRASAAVAARPSAEPRSGFGRVLPRRRTAPQIGLPDDDRQPGPPTAASSALDRAPAPVEALRLSTASIVGRWRKSAAPDVLRTSKQPDTTLVDIFRSERDIDDEHEPLTAALDVLRGSRQPVELG